MSNREPPSVSAEDAALEREIQAAENASVAEVMRRSKELADAMPGPPTVEEAMASLDACHAAIPNRPNDAVRADSDGFERLSTGSLCCGPCGSILGGTCVDEPGSREVERWKATHRNCPKPPYPNRPQDPQRSPETVQNVSDEVKNRQCRDCYCELEGNALVDGSFGLCPKCETGALQAEMSDLDQALLEARMKLLDDVCWWLNGNGQAAAAKALYDSEARQEMTLGTWRRTDANRTDEARSEPLTWLVVRRSSARYLGAYEWVRNAKSAAHFSTLEAADAAAKVAQESNGGVEVVPGLLRTGEAETKTSGPGLVVADEPNREERDHMRASGEKPCRRPGSIGPGLVAGDCPKDQTSIQSSVVDTGALADGACKSLPPDGLPSAVRFVLRKYEISNVGHHDPMLADALEALRSVAVRTGVLDDDLQRIGNPK